MIKKKYFAMIISSLVVVAFAASVSIGYSSWKNTLNDRSAEPAERMLEIHFKTDSGSALSSLNYVGLEYNSYLELPHRSDSSKTFLGWSLSQSGTNPYDINTVYQYSTIYETKYSSSERYEYNYWKCLYIP